jgi:mannose-1-phosphate guanylyltransferase
MAGGQGTRLWPLSRKLAPKQSLRLATDRTLFQDTLDRIRIFPPEDILVVTTQEQAESLQAQAPEIPAANFLMEPVPRGTAPVVAWAASELLKRSPSAVMACLPADHVVGNVPRFHALLEAAEATARRGFLVTLGIPPSYPSTGYGYIEQGGRLDVPGLEGFHVRSFREKPSSEEAAAYLARGGFLWNAGMFVWRCDRLLEEVERHLPAVRKAIDEISVAGEAARQQRLSVVWPRLERQTVDYGIMEKADRVAVLPAPDLGWVDVGSWDRLFEVLEPDAAGNVIVGDRVLARGARHSLIYQVGSGSPRLLSVIGVENLIVVDAGDVLMICPRDRAEEVRQVVDLLAQSGWEQYQ